MANSASKKVNTAAFIGNESFCVIDREFLEDESNLEGLDRYIQYIKPALCTILDISLPSIFLIELANTHIKLSFTQVQRNAVLLYGLLHARFITTESGLKKMHGKINRGEYSSCPRTKGEQRHTLPIGETNEPSKRSLRVFCPRCNEIYTPHESKFENIDGAFFGTYFPQLFLMKYPEFRKNDKIDYIGSLMRFKIHKSALTHPTKVIYNREKNDYEELPRPKAEFTDDETVIKKYAVRQRTMILQRTAYA